MNPNRTAFWVCLLARSRPVLSVLSVLATVAIAGHADGAGIAIEYSGEAAYALEEESLAPMAIRSETQSTAPHAAEVM